MRDCKNDTSTLESRPSLPGIHHLKFAVSDLDESLRFYERALGAKHMPELDHMRDNGIRYGLQTMCEGGGTANATLVELVA